jgi:hypothetical protein
MKKNLRKVKISKIYADPVGFIHCDRHGESQGGSVCPHLADDFGLEVYQALAENGEFSAYCADRHESFSKMKKIGVQRSVLMCWNCYQLCLDRHLNVKEPAASTGYLLN